MSIYWPDNNTFYDGKVIGYDNVTARHHVLYDSGDQEHVTLGTAKVPPSAHSVGHPLHEPLLVVHNIRKSVK